jgi:hypothetical protein
VRKIVVVTLLVLFLMAPVASLCEPIQCEWAMETGKLADWIVCALVAIMMGNGDWIPGGYYGYYP